MIRASMTSLITVIAFAAALALRPSALAAQEPPPIRLVVQITIDQLRGDMPARFADRFGEGGFRRLMERGIWYTDAHYLHATTYTAVGHATLFTGGNPPEHGIVGNDWLDTASGRHIYCVEDDRHHLLGRNPRPGQRVSPRNLTSTTTGDELILATAADRGCSASPSRTAARFSPPVTWARRSGTTHPPADS